MAKVLHITEYIKGGVSTYIDSLLGELKENPQWSNFRLLVSEQHKDTLKVIPPSNLSTFNYPQRSLGGLLNLHKAIGREIKTFQPDIIHLHSTFAGLIGRLPFHNGLFRRNAKVVYTPHGWSFSMDTSFGKKKIYENCEAWFSRFADAIICVSERELIDARAAGIPARKCFRVDSGLPEAPSPAPVILPPQAVIAKERGDLIVLFVGRFDRQKALDLLLAAMKQIEGHPLHLICAGSQVVGSTPMTFPPNTSNVGWVNPSQVTWLLNYCDTMIVPSRWEAFGLVTTEAMRSGRALITSNRGALPEINLHEVTGLVLEDLTVEHIAKTLTSITRNQLQTYGINGRARFESNYTSQKMAESTIAVYENVIK